MSDGFRSGRGPFSLLGGEKVLPKNVFHSQEEVKEKHDDEHLPRHRRLRLRWIIRSRFIAVFL